MEFTESLARKLVAQHDINETAVSRWRAKGYIPDQYGRGMMVHFRGEELVSADQLRSVLQLDYLDLKGLSVSLGLRLYQLQQWVAGKGKISKRRQQLIQDYLLEGALEMETYCGEMRSRLENSARLPLLRRILGRDMFRWSMLLESDPDYYKRLWQWKAFQRRTFPMKGCRQLRPLFMKLSAEIRRAFGNPVPSEPLPPTIEAAPEALQ